MHAGEPCAPASIELEAGIPHAERPEDVVAEIGVELLSADLLHRLADPIDVDAVVPSLAGVEQQRRGESHILAADDAGDSLFFLIADEIGAPDAVGESRRMGQQMPKREVASGP